MEAMYADHLEEYQALLELHGKTDKTIRNYMSTLRQYLTSLETEAPSYKSVQAFLSEKKRNGCENATIARHLSTLRLFFEMLGLRDTLAPLKTPRVRQKEIIFLEVEELKLFIKKAPTRKWKAIFALMYGGALRVGEAARCQKDHIEGIRYDADKRKWLVSKKVQGFVKIPALVDKTGKYTNVPLDVRTREIICDYLNSRRDTSIWLFPGRKEHLSEDTIKKKIPEHCAALGVTRISSHGLRRSRITHLVLDYYPLAKVSIFARHSDISMTMRYVHIRAQKDLEDLPSIFEN